MQELAVEFLSTFAPAHSVSFQGSAGATGSHAEGYRPHARSSPSVGAADRTDVLSKVTLLVAARAHGGENISGRDVPGNALLHCHCQCQFGIAKHVLLLGCCRKMRVACCVPHLRASETVLVALQASSTMHCTGQVLGPHWLVQQVQRPCFSA